GRVRHVDALRGLHVADERAQADAHGCQVENGLEEARQHDDPSRGARGDESALHDGPGVAGPQGTHAAAAHGGTDRLRETLVHDRHFASLSMNTRRPQRYPTTHSSRRYPTCTAIISPGIGAA